MDDATRMDGHSSPLRTHNTFYFVKFLFFYIADDLLTNNMNVSAVLLVLLC